MIKLTQEQANVIHAQLGGRRFALMVGAKNYAFNENYLSFKIGRGAKNSVNYARVHLTVMDTYDLVFYRANKNGIKEIYRSDGIYADMLAPEFERLTGLYTSL